MAKVLILDQSKSVRNILRERLEYEGFSAEAVEDEAAATDICGKVPFDLIISDTGCKVPDAGIPFIALSTDASIDSAVKAVRSATILGYIGAAVGVALAYYLTSIGNFALLTPIAMVVYQLLWLLPTLLLAGLVKHY